MRVTRHKIDALLYKETNGNDRMEVSRWRTYLALVNLAIVTLTDNNNAVFKDGGPEIASTKNLLCSSISRHVTATVARMAVIEDFFRLLKG